MSNGGEGDSVSSMDEINEMLSKAVAMDRDEVLKKEKQWPKEIRKEVLKVMNKASQVLDISSNDERPLVERMVEVRSKLGVTIARLSGTTVAEMIEHELEVTRLAEAMALLVALEEVNRDLTNGN
jgi:hypothetical protein